MLKTACEGTREARLKGEMCIRDRDNGHLDATDPVIVRSYIRKDPFIPIMTGERTPASIGVWMGILLIDEYMKTHACP